ncbi:hypothetical protein D3C80_1682600 [compost metagenome]
MKLNAICGAAKKKPPFPSFTPGAVQTGLSMKKRSGSAPTSAPGASHNRSSTAPAISNWTPAAAAISSIETRPDRIRDSSACTSSHSRTVRIGVPRGIAER